MARGNRDACVAVTLPHEGGYVDHPSDPGGATNMGITIGTLGSWRKRPVTKADVRSLSRKEAIEIYGANYWTPMFCESLPYGVDLATFDYGVNSGPARAARALQSVLRAKQTGRVNAETLNAATIANGKTTIQKLCAQRLGFVRGLKIFSTFGRGWTRRIADIEAKAVAMLLASGGPLARSDKAVLKEESAKAGKAAKQQGSVAGGAAAGGGGAGVVDATANGPNWLLILALVVLVAAVVAALIARARHNRDRAAAYEAAAAG